MSQSTGQPTGQNPSQQQKQQQPQSGLTPDEEKLYETKVGQMKNIDYSIKNRTPPNVQQSQLNEEKKTTTIFQQIKSAKDILESNQTSQADFNTTLSNIQKKMNQVLAEYTFEKDGLATFTNKEYKMGDFLNEFNKKCKNTGIKGNIDQSSAKLHKIMQQKLAQEKLLKEEVEKTNAWVKATYNKLVKKTKCYNDFVDLLNGITMTRVFYTLQKKDHGIPLWIHFINDPQEIKFSHDEKNLQLYKNNENNIEVDNETENEGNTATLRKLYNKNYEYNDEFRKQSVNTELLKLGKDILDGTEKEGITKNIDDATEKMNTLTEEITALRGDLENFEKHNISSKWNPPTSTVVQQGSGQQDVSQDLP